MNEISTHVCSEVGRGGVWDALGAGDITRVEGSGGIHYPRVASLTLTLEFTFCNVCLLVAEWYARVAIAQREVSWKEKFS